MNAPRRLIAYDRVSADGYFATPDGDLSWVVPDADLERTAADAIEQETSDTLLFGRRTYQQFESFWPHALSAAPAAPDPHRPGRSSRALRAMAVMIHAADKVVFSRTLPGVSWENSRLFHEFDPAVVRQLKDQPGRDIMIFGSGSIVSLLTAHGLIDEYQFIVSPLLLGAGRPLVSGVSRRLRLDLQEAKAFPSGNVMLRYTRAA